MICQKDLSKKMFGSMTNETKNQFRKFLPELFDIRRLWAKVHLAVEYLLQAFP
jgi:hypothetical protein